MDKRHTVVVVETIIQEQKREIKQGEGGEGEGGWGSTKKEKEDQT